MLWRIDVLLGGTVQLPKRVLGQIPGPLIKESCRSADNGCSGGFESRKLKSPASSDRSGCQKRLLLAELLVGPRKKISAWLPKASGLHLKVRAQHGSLTCGPPFVPKVQRAQRIFIGVQDSARNAAVPARFGGTR